MVIDLKLCRFESAPWGFRLIGGTDFEFPLTVVKVTEGSLADQAGMRVGDVIVRINDEPTCNMTHNDAHDVISKCGNNFFLGVVREDEQSETEEENICNQSEIEMAAHESTEQITSEIKNVSSQYEEHSEATTTVETTYESHMESSETHEEKATEEVIAEMMSGEAEVLKEHNVIGVNFNRIFPKAGICQGSEVFRTLNDEAIKTKKEIEKEKRKWTTFLQKPDRPIPKSKNDIIEEQIKSEPYKVRIVKQVKPARMPTPPSEPKPEPEPLKEPEKEVEKIVEEPPKPLADTEVPNLESELTKTCEHDGEKGAEENNAVEKKDKEEETKPEEDVEIVENATNLKEDSHTEEVVQVESVVVEKTEEEILLEKQLESVQQQLLALSSLPSTIQATLDAVTKQLTELLPTFRLQTEPIKAGSPPVEVPKQEETQEEQGELPIEGIDDIKTDEDIEEIKEISAITSAIPQVPDQIRSPEPIPIEIEQLESEEEQVKMQEELQYKKQKIEKWNRIFCEEHKERVYFREYNLTQLTGRQRNGVNFLKYQKPEKKIDIEKSEVYKVVHHLEKAPRRGIEIRAPKVPAEEDIRSRATPMTCG